MAKAKKAAPKKTAAKKNSAPKNSAPKRSYPRRSLEDALLIATKIKEYNGGNAWAPNEVANALGSAPKSSDFFYWTAAARDYGITDGSRDTSEIKLTDLGRRIVYAPTPEEESAAKIEAFFSIKVFKEVFDYYGGSNLPELKYLSNTLESNFSLDPQLHSEFITIFKENCDYLELNSGNSNAIKAKSADPNSSFTRIIAEPTTGKNHLKIFVALPFIERNPERPNGFFSEVLNNLIVPAATDAGFKVETANQQGTDIIQSTIINELLEADLVLADLTDHNPNVLFELGLRMALDKPVVIIKAKGTKGIFDVDSMMRYFEYDPNLWRSTLEKDLPALQDHIKATWEKKDTQPSYINILTRK